MARYGAVSDDSATGIQELIPDLILPEVVATAEEQNVFMPLARRFDLTGEGANFTIPQAGALTWAALTIDGTAPDETAFNTSARTLTPVPIFLDVVVPITAFNAASVDLQAEIGKEAGVGLSDYHDTAFAGLYTERPTSAPDHFIGTDATILSFSDLRAAQELLYVQKAPKRFAWVVHPTQFSELLQDNVFIDASVKGSSVLTQGIGANGMATSVLDVDVFVAEQIVESAGLHSMMFSRNRALAYGFKRISRLGGSAQELMMDVEWDSTRRTVEINMTIEADYEGAKGSSTTTNNWLVDIIS
jgi:hypothetical protein